MCLKKLTNILLKRYSISEIYVGLLGYVTEEKDRSISINASDKKFIIYRKVAFDYWGDFVAKDIFTKKDYFFWNGNRYESDTIFKAVDNYAVYKSLPIEQFLSIPKEFITKSELLSVYNKLNNYQSPKVIAEPEKVQITDSIFKTILETNELVKKTLIDEKVKEKIVKELEVLGQYYIDAMVKINEKSNNSNDLTLESEYSIRMQVIERLVELEEMIKNPTSAKVYNLKQQYDQFQRDLNDNN